MEGQSLILPVKFEDLYSDENEVNHGFNLTSFEYGSNYDTETLVERLEEFSDVSDPLQSPSLSNGDINNLFFWAIKEFPSLPLSLKAACMHSLQDLAEYVVSNGYDGLNHVKKQNAKKALFYFVHALHRAEQALSKEKDTVHALSLASKSSGSGKSKASAKSKNAAKEGFDWTSLRRVCLSTLDKIVSLSPSASSSSSSYSLSFFWPMGLVEETFTTAVWKYALSLLEERPVGVGGLSQQDVTCRSLCVSVVAKSVSFFASSASSGSFSALGSALLSALLKAEHMCAQVAEILRLEAALSTSVNNAVNGAVSNAAEVVNNSSQLTHELLAEMAKVNLSILSSSALKHLSLFLESLSRVDTARFTLSMPLVVSLVDSPAHQLRSAMLQAMGHVLAYIHATLTDNDKRNSNSNNNNNTDEVNLHITEEEIENRQRNLKLLVRQRDALLDMLIERTHDTSPYTRTALLKVWTSLVDAQAVPVKKIGSVSEVAVDRLYDKNAFVRRAAVALLTALVDANPFSGRLERDLFQRQRETCEAALRERLEQLAEKTGTRVDLGENEETEEREGETDRKKKKRSKERRKSVEKLLSRREAKERERETERDSEHSESESDAEKDNNKEKDKDEKKSIKRKRGPKQSDESENDTDKGTKKKNNDKEEDEKEEEEEDELDEEMLLRDASQDEVILELRQKREYLLSALELIVAIESAVPRVSALLDSKNTSDVVESVRFFSRAVNFNVKSALEKFKDAFKLIWHEDASVRAEVLSSFAQVYLTDGAREHAVPLSATETALNLMRLVQQCSQSELVSLEAIVAESLSLTDNEPSAQSVRTQQVLECLLARASQCVQQTRRERQSLLIPPVEPLQQQSQNQIGSLCSDLAAALSAVHMIFSRSAPTHSQPLTHSLLSPTQLRALTHCGLGSVAIAYRDFSAMRIAAACLARTCAGVSAAHSEEEKEVWAEVVRALVRVLRLPLDQLDCSVKDWFCAAEEAMHTIYKLHPNPEEVVASVVHMYHTTLSHNAQCDAHTLAAQVFLLGHAAVCTVVYAESIAGEAKKRMRVGENDTHAEKKSSTESAKSKAKKGGKKSSKKGDSSDDDSESESDAGGDVDDFAEAMSAQAESDFAADSALHTLTERLLVLDTDTPEPALIAQFRPLVVYIVANDRGTFSDPTLRSTAVLSLARIASVSSHACTQALPLLFTLLEREPQALIRLNVVVALSDLAFRFPNAVEPWTLRMFCVLRDKAPVVRHNALLSLTHLVLNDMLKVKGHVKHVVHSLVDEDEELRELARVFFVKLSARAHNPLFHLLGDLVAHFSRDEEEVQASEGDEWSRALFFSPEQFKETFRFLFSLVQKDKRGDVLFERLLLRLVAAETARQRKNLAFCLAELSVSEKALKKLIEHARNLKLVLQDDEVFAHFGTVLQKARKSRSAPSAAEKETESAPANTGTDAVIAKSVIEEAEKLLNAVANNEEAALFSSTTEGDNNAENGEEDAANKSKGRRVLGKKTTTGSSTTSSRRKKTATSTAPKARRRKKKADSDDEDDDDDDDEEEEEQQHEEIESFSEDDKPTAPPKKKKSSAKTPTRGKKKVTIQDSDEEADF